MVVQLNPLGEIFGGVPLTYDNGLTFNGFALGPVNTNQLTSIPGFAPVNPETLRQLQNLQAQNHPNQGFVGAANQFLFGTPDGVNILPQTENKGILDFAGFGAIEKTALIVVGGFIAWKVLTNGKK